MRIGFTGTQQGMTKKQQAALSDILGDRKLHIVEVHQGDCAGADAQAHDIATQLDIAVILHSPANHKTLTGSAGRVPAHDEKPYLERNHDIVDCTDKLVAAPKGTQEDIHSGTWAAVRYARTCGKPVHVIWPNGSAG